ncbi:hypothetical protein BH24BAC1_BH24BAC1_06560 [soil metagenome]
MRKKTFFYLTAALGLLAGCSPSEPKAGNFAEAAPTPGALTANYSIDLTLDELLTQHQDYARIPLKKMTSGHLHMDASLNGVNGRFILDTGAGATVLDEKKIARFGLVAQKSKRVATGTGGGAIGMQVSPGNSLQIGPLEIDDFSIYLMSLEHMNKAFQTMKLEEVDGIIGSDILTSKRGVIDYTNLMLYLRN